eukprot:Skav215916  [mRNA]  locus=scaffold226:90762:91895:- [translate_table: standard]
MQAGVILSKKFFSQHECSLMQSVSIYHAVCVPQVVPPCKVHVEISPSVAETVLDASDAGESLGDLIPSSSQCDMNSHVHANHASHTVSCAEHPLLLFRVDKDATVFIPHARSRSDAWFHVELFSGGFGGWKQANHVMQQVGIPWSGSLAVENDPNMCAMYANSFRIRCVLDDNDPLLDTPCPVFDMNHALEILFRGSVTDFQWMQLVPWGSNIVVTVSSPCPPWSASSDKDGMSHADGMLLARVILMLRFLRPKAIAFENVATICEHADFPTVIGLLKWSGFQLNWEKQSDLRAVAPTSRKRWLAVCTQTHEDFPKTKQFDLVDIPCLSLATYKAFVQLPEAHERALTLDATLKAFYGDGNFVGAFWKDQVQAIFLR